LRPALSDHLAQFVENLIAVQQFAAVPLAGATFQLRFEVEESRFAVALLTLQQSQGFPHHLTRSLVPAGGDASLEKGVQSRRERDVDRGSVGHAQ
jgi:hypothetical protein